MTALLKKNLANIFTITRLILAVWLVFLAFNGPQLVLMFLIVIACGVLDSLDGWTARRFNAITNFGAFIDRLADKIFICPLLIILAWRYWPNIAIVSPLKLLTEGLVALIILLEIFLMISGVIGAIKGLDISSNKWGRAKMVFQSAAVLGWFLMLILDQYFPRRIFGETLISSAYILLNLFLLVAIGLAVKSLEGYWQRWQNFSR